jgi:hypothetical protein
MSAAHGGGGSGSSAAMGFGPRLFSRAMSWACLAVAAAMTVLAVGSMAMTMTLASGGLTACKSAGSGGVVFKFNCQKDRTTTTIAKVVHMPNGRTTTTVVAAPTPDMPGWTSMKLAALLGMAPPLLLAGALWPASRFFAGLAGGRTFQARTVRGLRDFAVLGVAFLLCDSFLEPLVNGVLRLFGGYGVYFSWPYTRYEGPAAHSTWVMSGSGLMEIVFAATLIAMVSVLARAAAISEDHAQIV